MIKNFEKYNKKAVFDIITGSNSVKA